MFEVNYTAKKAIKAWAKVFYYTAIALPILSLITFLILLCVDAEYLWWIGLTIFAGSLITALSLMFFAHIVWGYGEIVNGVRKMSLGTGSEIEQADASELPEL